MAISLAAGLVQPALAQDTGSAGIGALKRQIEQDRTRAIALLRAALVNAESMDVPDRLWVMSQLAKNLGKALKYEEALVVVRQAEKEAEAIPVQRVHFVRQAMMHYRSMDKNQLALAEYAKIAPLLPTLSGKSGELEGHIEAAHAWAAGGTVMSGLGQLPEAMELLTRAMRVFDANPGQAKGQADGLSQIAHVHFKTGDTDAAVREVQRLSLIHI